MATIELNKENFDSALADNDILLIDFWAQWCGPCKMFGPVFEQAAEKHQDVAFAKVNTEEQQELAASFGIRSIPTLAAFKEKVLVFMQPGALPETALEELVGKVKELDMDEVRKEMAAEKAAEKGKDEAAA